MRVIRRGALLVLLLVLACHQLGTREPPRTEATPCVRAPPPPVDVLGDGTCSRPCRVDPPSTSMCVAGRCVSTLVQSGVGVGSMAVDGQGIYWTGSDATFVNQLPLSGGIPAAISVPEIRSYNGWINSLAARDGLVYVGFSLGIVAVPNMGGHQLTLFDTGAGPSSKGEGQPRLMALGASEIYVLLEQAGPFSTISSIVTRMPLQGGTPATLYVAPPIQHEQTDVRQVPVAMRMAADSQNIYWSEAIYRHDTSVIRKVPIAGGDMSTLATVQVPWTSIATDATGVYWTDAAAGTVMKASPDGSTVITLASGQTHPSLILSDGETVYWADDSCQGETTGAILKMNATGGTPEVIASGISINNDGAFAVQGESLFWNSKDGIMKISPR